MQLFKTPNIRFMKYKYIALAVTALIVLAGLLNIIFGKGLKLGVDFGEGTLIRVMFKSPVSVGDIRSELGEVGLGNSVIQEAGKNGREFQIRTMEVISTKEGPELESHEKQANDVIVALRGDDGRAEQAAGLRDLNGIDRRTLAALLETQFPGQGEGLAEKVIDQRTAIGIYSDFAQLSEAGVAPDVISFLKEKTYLGKLTLLSRETVGPQVGKDLRRRATQAIIWSLIGMLVYIAVRFKLANGVSAIFTLTQDVLITLSIYSFTNREINLPIIAGLLTIVGFSINDTIVIFDRIRENQKSLRKMALEEVMNLSLNQMLGRTVITSGTVFLTVMALFLFGGKVINDFAFIMLVGTIEGVYSTIYLSCPVVLFWQKLFKPGKGGRR
ncbi:MAG: protein-export membrane protein SecF [Candidatus Aminicenantes bacterium RBG_19FT_COMBO_58_17]|nr:MAG: protein-export membrane protein SecF [Candidatus Aminicenantes bacterium RBG_19FT_COMBO_58_17]HCS47107.1 protein translocase subunit SecF [Candidatus Aminicenantes bacterium]